VWDAQRLEARRQVHDLCLETSHLGMGFWLREKDGWPKGQYLVCNFSAGKSNTWRWSGLQTPITRRDCALGSQHGNRAGIYHLRMGCRCGWIRVLGDVHRVTIFLRVSLRCLAGSDCSLHLCQPTTRIARMHASVYRRLDGVLCGSLRADSCTPFPVGVVLLISQEMERFMSR
jgi:hypothetical protein